MATLKDTIVHDRLGVMGDIVSGDYKYNIVYDGGSSVGLTFGDSTYPTTIQGDTATVTTTLILTSSSTYGLERIYSTGSNYWDISGNKSISSNYTLYLPKASGSLVVSTNNTAIGGTYIPVYVDSNNEVQVCKFKDDTTTLLDVGCTWITTLSSGSKAYYPTLSETIGTSSGTKVDTLYANSNITYYAGSGYGEMYLGSSDGYGALRIYGSSSYWQITGSNKSGGITLHLPAAPSSSGCLIAGTNNTATGGTYEPVYVDSSNQVVKCSFTSGTDLSDIGTNKSDIAAINAKFVATGDSTHAVYIDASGNFQVCEEFLPTAGGTMYGTIYFADGDTVRGYITTMTGQDDNGITYGIGMSSNNGDYVIVTTAGVRMSCNNGNSIEVVSSGAICNCKLSVSGELAVTGAATFNGGVTISGGVEVSGGLSVVGGNFNVSENGYVGGNLSVTGSLTVGGTSITTSISNIERRLTALENG